MADETLNIAIVGAGAAGLTAGIFARQSNPSASVVLLDGAKSIGAKILVSGGGRCNVTHARVGSGDYNGSKNIVRNVLAAFDERRTVEWMASMGVTLKAEETGKLFPVSDRAKTVLDALVGSLNRAGAQLRTDHRVSAVTAGDGGFCVQHAQGQIMAGQVILCCGGRSLPKTGSDGGGYELARALGHEVGPTWPGLVPLVLDASFFHGDVTGIAHEARLTTLLDSKPVDRRSGSLLWTHFGISGPLAMDASRHFLAARAAGKARLLCGLAGDESFEQVEAKLMALSAQKPRAMLAACVRAITPLPERLVEAVLRRVGVAGATPMAQLSRDARRMVAHGLTALELPVAQDRGWNYAEVTAGGVPLSEIDYRTMASRKTRGLYLAGEILDCDGRIGGFNFQWAWATGHLAGVAAGRAAGGG